MEASNLNNLPAPRSHGLQDRLTQMLQKQLAMEERIARQDELIQSITYGFAVLREYATRAVTHMDLSLHDLLIAETYIDAYPSEGDTTLTAVPHAVGGTWRSITSQDDTAKLLAEEAKKVYAMFVRKRVLDEASPEPDSSSQFHTLTAASFHLLLPHLTVMLEEFVGIIEDGALPSAAPAVSGGGAPTRCVTVGRVVRFVELGVKHFPEVVASSGVLARMQAAISVLVTADTECSTSSGVGPSWQLSQRVSVLSHKMQFISGDEDNMVKIGTVDTSHGGSVDC